MWISYLVRRTLSEMFTMVLTLQLMVFSFYKDIRGDNYASIQSTIALDRMYFDAQYTGQMHSSC